MAPVRIGEVFRHEAFYRSNETGRPEAKYFASASVDSPLAFPLIKGASQYREAAGGHVLIATLLG
jgi:hypothetical protein